MRSNTSTWVPGSVKTFSNMPSLSLYQQNGKGHLTHGAKVFRGRSAECMVCVFNKTGSGWEIMVLLPAVSVSWHVINSRTILIVSSLYLVVIWLGRNAFLGLFPRNASSFGHSGRCRQRISLLLFLSERFIIPNVIFRLVFLWHLEKKIRSKVKGKDFLRTLVLTQGRTFDNIP